MENTIQNKAIFFAQYFGQKILKKDIIGLEKFITEPDGFLRSMSQEIYLELKPFSSITDEDYRVIVQNKVMNPEHLSDDIELQGRIGGIYLSDITTSDYLRSKGYALPYMGLSVETLIEYGWIKLKSE